MRRSCIALMAALISSPGFADTLITNANGVQVSSEARTERFGSLLIGDDGRVKQIFQSAQPKIGNVAHVIDAGGRTLLPGLIDAHGHVIELGLDALRLDLVGTSSIQDLKERLHKYAATHPNAHWILGAGWNQELWPEKRFPTASDLDAAVADRPVVLERVDGHALVANGAAMNAAKVSSATPAPPGGHIENGLFVDAAKGLIETAIPKPTPGEMDVALQKAQDILLGFGVTGVGSMSTSLADWDAFRRAGDEGRLNVRLMVYLTGFDPGRISHPTDWMYGDRLRAVGIKFFADGALGSRGAWLKAPYADKPETRGLQFHSDSEILELTDKAAKAGFQIATHAIGDAANAQIISTYEQLHRKYPGDRRWRIEHFQIADPADIPRMSQAGIIASMQPTHQTSDRLMAEARLGASRLKGAYAWHTVLESGAKLAFGSDFPVESPNPFPGLSAAISRQDVNGQPAGGWIPSERVSIGQALYAFTRGAAYAGFAEEKIGALEPGKWADFIIVDGDPAAIDQATLAKTQVLETWVAGRKVWSKKR